MAGCEGRMARERHDEGFVTKGRFGAVEACKFRVQVDIFSMLFLPSIFIFLLTRGITHPIFASDTNLCPSLVCHD